MFFPINGRVAIIDNEIEEVKPLFQIFGKHRIPFTFFDASDFESLPDSSDESNDIRLLFLDLNLVDKATQSIPNVRSSLYSVLSRIITPNNFPYLIIVWSTQESAYLEVLLELFENQLKDRKPIAIKTFVKSDYILSDGEIKRGDEDLVNKVVAIFREYQAYSTLVYWENKVHKSADFTLQNIFDAYDDSWENSTNFIIEKLSQAYLGFKNHKVSNYSSRIKGSLQAFNYIFYDTLESQINLSSNIEDQNFLVFDQSKLIKPYLLDLLNFKLLASDTELELDYTGAVIQDSNPLSDSIFNDVLNESINRFNFKDDKWGNLEGKDLFKALDKEYSVMRSENRKTWKKVYVVVTPLCDKVQNKHRKIRLVKGVIIEKKFKKFLDDKSESVYISPSFFLEEEKKSFILILNFRFLFTYSTNKNDIKRLKFIKNIFRLRSTLISEIQSKLARHISRQGILYVE